MLVRGGFGCRRGKRCEVSAAFSHTPGVADRARDLMRLLCCGGRGRLGNSGSDAVHLAVGREEGARGWGFWGVWEWKVYAGGIMLAKKEVMISLARRMLGPWGTVSCEMLGSVSAQQWPGFVLLVGRGDVVGVEINWVEY